MHLLLTPAGVLLYVGLGMVAAFAGRDRRMGFWGFFWCSMVLTPIVTGFFLLMAEPVRPPAAPAAAQPKPPTL